MWTPLESTFVTTKTHIKVRCSCGKESRVRPIDIIYGKSSSCRSCATRLRMQNMPKQERREMAKKGSIKAAELAQVKRDSNPYRRRFGREYDYLRSKASTIKQRCTNPNAIGFSNYGGRGIKFEFASPSHFAIWVLDNLGPKPEDKQSLDRIDNNRHYEKGNLRWANYAEQNNNKLAYKRTNNGERIRKIRELRPDLCYETIRVQIIKGMTDAEIITRGRYERTSV